MDSGGSPITSYTVTSSPGGFTGTSSTSPIIITGLTNGTAYTFTVTATNAFGTSVASTASPSVTPSALAGAPTIGTATSGNGQATVTFTAPGSNGGSSILYYTVTSTSADSVQQERLRQSLSQVFQMEQPIYLPLLQPTPQVQAPLQVQVTV